MIPQLRLRVPPGQLPQVIQLGYREVVHRVEGRGREGHWEGGIPEGEGGEDRGGVSVVLGWVCVGKEV